MPIKKIIYLSVFLCACSHQQAPASEYEALKERIISRQQYFSELYASSNPENRTEIVRQAQDYLVKTIIDSIFPCWYGTPWNFNGTTVKPGQGSIACGYFVTTVLSDAGFKIPRVKWAQSASEPVIVKIATNIKRFRKQPLNDLFDYLNEHGDGLYIIGLDCHVGFIVKSGSRIRFVHANYYRPQIGVMSEPVEGRNPLNDSKYRIVGKLLETEMIKNWIKGSIFF